MGFTSHPVETTSLKNNPFKQYLKGFAGPIIAASEVRVYQRLKNGQPGRLIRIEPPTYFDEIKRANLIKRIANA